MRKIASIQKVINVEPIPDADKIETITVLGWHIVTQKDHFKIGDYVVYCEVDSLMPSDNIHFDFLKSDKGVMQRIRTIKLRGQVSQGICFDTSILPEGTPIEEGLDVSEILGITKYEAPIPACLSGLALGNVPGYISKTEEERVQTIQSTLDKYNGKVFLELEKIDGSSSTFYTNEGKFGVCGHNIEWKDGPKNSFWKFAHETDLETKLLSLNRNIAFQGEICGPGIQSNKYALKKVTILFFRALDIDKHKFLSWDELSELVHGFGLETVPVISTDYVLENNIDTLVERATRKSILNPKIWQEGTVFVLADGSKISDGRVSFKAINPKFLLKYDE